MSDEVKELTKAQIRRQQGLCASCGMVYTGDNYRCPKCIEIRNKNSKRLRTLKLKKGYCTDCGQPVDNPDFRMCSNCRAKDRARRVTLRMNIGSSEKCKEKRKREKLKKVEVTNKLILSIVRKSAKSVDIEGKYITKLTQKVQIELELLGLS